MDDAIIIFTVYDKDFFGMVNEYVADGLLMFQDIPESETGAVKFVELKLMRPPSEGIRI